MDDGAWRALLETQQGLASRAQLRSHGVTADQLRWRLGRSWRLVLPQVVDQRGGSLTPTRRLIATALEAGPSSVISAHHACLWHGLQNAHGHAKVVALVSASQASRTTGFVRVVRTRRPVAVPVVRGVLRLAPPARAVVDAARDTRSAHEAAAIVIEAVQRGLVSTTALVHEVERGAGARSCDGRSSWPARERGRRPRASSSSSAPPAARSRTCGPTRSCGCATGHHS